MDIVQFAWKTELIGIFVKEGKRKQEAERAAKRAEKLNSFVTI